MERASGILLPLFSLPSPYGIGTMGRAAYEFADFLHAAGQRYWQLLPLGPTGYGDSPYQSFSTYAGNPYFIDLELLAEDGLLTQAELSAREWGNDPRRVDTARSMKTACPCCVWQRPGAGSGTGTPWPPLRRRTPRGCRTMPCSWR